MPCLSKSPAFVSIYKIQIAHLYRMRTEDGFPFIKIPGKKSIMFNEKDIEGYMATHKK
jgi:predicted DNA-binding transcriptional regulator AlpA